MPRENESFEDFLNRIYPDDIKGKDQNDIAVVSAKAVALANFVSNGEFDNAIKTSSFEVEKLVSEIRNNLKIIHPDFHANSSLDEQNQCKVITTSLTDTLTKLRDIQKSMRSDRNTTDSINDDESKAEDNNAASTETDDKYQEREDEIKHDADSDIPRARNVDETDQEYQDYLADFYDTKMIETRGIDYINEQYYVIQKQTDNLFDLKRKILSGDLSDEEKKTLTENYDRIKASIEKRTAVLDAKAALYMKKKEEEKARSEDTQKNMEDPGEAIIKASEQEQTPEERGVAVANVSEVAKTPEENVSDINAIDDTINKDSVTPEANTNQLPANVIVKKKRSGITKKSLIWIAGGLLAGVAVGFTVGPAGIMIANIAAGLGKAALNYAANKIEAKEIEEVKQSIENGEINLPAGVESVEEPSNALKTNFERFKKYIKSPEGLRDISKGLTAFMVGTAIGRFGQSVLKPDVPNATAQTDVTSKPEVTSQPDNMVNTNPTQPTTQPDITNAAPQTDPYADIRVGDNVGNYNVSTGHDTALGALNNTNSEHLIGDLVNGDSTFKRFAIPGADGQWQMINDSGISITDVCAKYGLDPSQVAVDVGKDGISQAWVSVNELVGTATRTM